MRLPGIKLPLRGIRAGLLVGLPVVRLAACPVGQPVARVVRCPGLVAHLVACPVERLAACQVEPPVGRLAACQAWADLVALPVEHPVEHLRRPRHLPPTWPRWCRMHKR